MSIVDLIEDLERPIHPWIPALVSNLFSIPFAFTVWVHFEVFSVDGYGRGSVLFLSTAVGFVLVASSTLFWKKLLSFVLKNKIIRSHLILVINTICLGLLIPHGLHWLWLVLVVLAYMVVYFVVKREYDRQLT